jgi:hypothetical protein
MLFQPVPAGTGSRKNQGSGRNYPAGTEFRCTPSERTSKRVIQNGDYLVLNSRGFFGKICEFVGEWLEKTTYKT